MSPNEFLETILALKSRLSSSYQFTRDHFVSEITSSLPLNFFPAGILLRFEDRKMSAGHDPENSVDA